MKSFIFLVCFTALFQLGRSEWPSDCKKENTINDMCYLVKTAYRSVFNKAEVLCKSSGGILALIKDEETNRKITDVIQATETRAVWIGIKYDSNKGKYMYVDGTEQMNNKYNKWGFGYPKGESYECVYLSIDGYWYDYLCSNIYPFICQYEGKPCNTRNITIEEGAEFNKCHADAKVPTGFNVSITCQKGYRLVGSSQVTCLSTGEWSEMPKCSKTCPPPQSYPNANITFVKDYYDVGSSAFYVCDEGYFSTTNPTKSHFKITCSSSSQWIPPGSGCSPMKTYQIKNIEVMPKSTVKLTCDIYMSSLNQSRNGDYIWLKDSNSLLSNQTEYELDPQGSLIIYGNPAKSIEGYYMCFLKGNSIVPGNTIYDLKYTKSQCNDDSSTDVKIHYEYLVGTSTLLQCPHSSLYSRFQWFKDGKEFPLIQGHVLYPEGSLLIRHVKLSHKGTYTCEMTEKDSICSKNITVELDVLPLPENICGNVEHSSHHPWTVSLWKKEEIAPFCYGTLIHESWVITTAHCLSGLYRKRKLDVFVRFGKDPILDISSEDSDDNDVVDIPIIKVKIHPQFSKHVHANDVGLVKLKQPVQYSETIQPICVSEIDFTLQTSCGSPPLKSGIATGWGSLERDEVQKISLREENMTLVPHSTCFPSDCYYSDQVLCFKMTPGTKETFASDSGSPLEVAWKDRVYLLGIFSRGERIARFGEYDYFTKISSNFPWFASFTGEDEIYLGAKQE